MDRLDEAVAIANIPKQHLLPDVLPTYPPFGKRMLMDNGWFRTLTRDDITLNASGAVEVRPHSVVGGDGAEYEVDVLVLATGFDGSLLTTLEVQARYVSSLLQEMFRRDIGSVECRQDVHDTYNERVDEAHERMVWTHPGMSTYYRNSRGRVVVNSPWRNVDFWHFARDPDLDEFVVEPRHMVSVAS
jgi:4-hydroxyacetophenone monooxygenase